MIYHDEIHFTTLYMADLETRAEPLDEGARAEKGKGKERHKPLWRREGMQHVRTAYLFLISLIILSDLSTNNFAY